MTNALCFAPESCNRVAEVGDGDDEHDGGECHCDHYTPYGEGTPAICVDDVKESYADACLDGDNGRGVDEFGDVVDLQPC